jgi:hypothetical protein
MGKPSTVGLGFETPFVDLWTVRDYPDLPGSRLGFRAFSKSLRGQEETLAINDYPYIEALNLSWSRRLSHADRRRSKGRRGLV